MKIGSGHADFDYKLLRLGGVHNVADVGCRHDAGDRRLGKLVGATADLKSYVPLTPYGVGRRPRRAAQPGCAGRGPSQGECPNWRNVPFARYSNLLPWGRISSKRLRTGVAVRHLGQNSKLASSCSKASRGMVRLSL